MTSQWDKLCEILERAEKLPAKHKSAYLQSAFMNLALQSHTKLQARDLTSMTAKMQAKSSTPKPRKRRRTTT